MGLDSFIGHNYPYLFKHPWKVLKVFTRIADEIKYFWQRGRRGYSDRDLWHLHGYLSSWMPQALRTLAWNKTGYPLHLCKGPYDCKCRKDHHKEWISILVTMANGFEAGQLMADLEYNDMPSFKKNLRHYEKMITRGLELFTKHYLALWD